MRDVFATLGILVSIMIGTGIIIFAFGYLVEKIINLYDRFKLDQQEVAVRDMGNRLLNESWWFSEDKKTMEALVSFANTFKTHGRNYRVEQVRENWRSKVNV